MLSQNSVVKLEITDFVAGGLGLAKKEGFPVFVEGAAVGDVVKARVTFAKPDFAEAKIEEIIQPSPDRVAPRCKHFSACGGCTLQHIKYPAQVKYKHHVLCEVLAKVAGINADLVLPMLSAPLPWYYRNKVQLPLKRLKNEVLLGYFMPGTHKVVNMEECFVQEAALTEMAEFVRELVKNLELSIYDEVGKTGILRHLIVRGSRSTGEILLGLVVNAKTVPLSDEVVRRLRQTGKNVVGIVASENRFSGNIILGEKNKTLWGRDYYFDQLGSFKFKISFPSFYQVNHSQVMALYNKILEFADLKRKDVVVDAYAGVGTICAWVANLAGEVYGIEEVASACSDAEANMKMNRIGNVKYGEGRVEEILPELLKMGIKPSVIIVDPPRAGCTSEAIKALPAARPAKIIYVSCAPATLGRDLKKLTAAGYALKVVQPIDMFPHTAHIESVSLLEKTARAC